MSDPFAAVSIGQTIVNSARFHNAVAAVVREFIRNGEHLARIGGGPGDMGEPACVRVPVRNITGAVVPEFGVMQVAAATFEPLVAVNEWRDPVFEGTQPALECDFAIAQRPLRAGEISACAIAGATWAIVNVTATGHKFAKPTTLTDRLQSGTTGPAKILWKESGLGLKKALILLLGCECGCACVGGGPGGGGTGVCTVPGPLKCAACLIAVVRDFWGNEHTVYLYPGGLNNFPQFGCSYNGSDPAHFAGPVSVSVSVTQLGITTNVSFRGEDLTYFACKSWDGESCIPFGSIVSHGGSGSGSGTLLLSLCPGTCPPQFGGGGGTGGDPGTGGGGEACIPCDPATDSPCFNCQNGQFCANAGACFGGGAGAMSSAGGCGCGSGTSGGAKSGGMEQVNKYGTGILNYAEKIAKDVFDAEIALVDIPAMLSGTSTPTTLSANVNDYAPNTGLAARLRLSTDGGGARTITGVAGGVSGYRMVIKNYGSQTINLTHEDAASSAANRFTQPGALPYVLIAGGTIEYQYDGATSRWEQV